MRATHEQEGVSAWKLDLFCFLFCLDFAVFFGGYFCFVVLCVVFVGFGGGGCFVVVYFFLSSLTLFPAEQVVRLVNDVLLRALLLRNSPQFLWSLLVTLHVADCIVI